MVSNNMDNPTIEVSVYLVLVNEERYCRVQKAVWNVLDNTLWYGILINRNQDTHKLENLSYNCPALFDKDNNKIVLNLQTFYL